MVWGVLQLLAIEYGIVVTSRDAETTTTIALHCLLAFLTLYGESYIQPSVLFVNPSWVLVSTKQPGGLLANFVTVSSRAARVTDSAEQHFFFNFFLGKLMRFLPGFACEEGMDNSVNFVTVSSRAAHATDSAEQRFQDFKTQYRFQDLETICKRGLSLGEQLSRLTLPRSSAFKTFHRLLRPF
jgi:hypothetical protein